MTALPYLCIAAAVEVLLGVAVVRIGAAIERRGGRWSVRRWRTR